MTNDFLGQIGASVLGNARGGQPTQIGSGSGDLLGGILGRGAGSGEASGALGESRSGLAGKGDLIAMLLPLALQWVQRNGGIGAVSQRFQQKRHNQQAASWMSTGANDALARQAIDEVVGMDELSRLSQQLGVSHDDVSGGLAQILPEVVNQMTPEGRLPEDGESVLNQCRSAVSQWVLAAQRR